MKLDYIQRDGFFITTLGGISLKLDGPYHDLQAVRNYFEKYRPKKGDIVIDAGAFAGAFSLVVSQWVGDDGKVIAFEPDAENYKRLLNNIKLNNAVNIIAMNKGLWSSDTLLPFNQTGSGNSSFFFDSRNLSAVVTVPVVNLDEELERLGIKKVDFLKMDIEGAEIEALKGCKRMLENNDVKLAIGSYHIVNGQQTVSKIGILLNGLGYKTESSFPEHLTTYASKT